MNRSEILFLYDTTWINPNGDPVDENKPRIDEESGLNIVTDVRLKRTIRDYLKDFKNKNIFVKEISDDEGKIQDAKQRAEDFLFNENGKIIGTDKKNLSLGEYKTIINNNILKDCVDVRLFGATIPLEKTSKEKSSVTLTGPVQFQMGISLHKVKLEYIKGTAAFATDKNKTQKGFREEYVLPYSLISFYGIINENAAKYSQMTDEDINLLMEAMWNGTKNLISRSKVGQIPRLLLKVNYKEDLYHIGELNRYIKFNSELNDENIRSIDDGILDVSKLIEILLKEKDKINSIDIAFDKEMKTNPENIFDALNGITINQITF